MSQKGTIGIVGGGQLGRMLTEAALKLDFGVIVLDPTPNSPASQVGAEQIIGDWYDADSLKELVERADYITVETEHLDAKLLDSLSASGESINPSPQTIVMIQDKLAQKRFLREHNVSVADFLEVNNPVDAEKAFQEFGGKMLLKTRFGAYDGRGNAVIQSTEELAAALKAFGEQPLYAERFITFTKELAVMVARDAQGEIVSYPVTETFHERNICIETQTPAQVSSDTTKLAEETALNTAEHLEGAGVFGIELFLTSDGHILVNEIAPRVHNSGHYTIEACETSQFEQHIRAITGLELGSTKLKVPAAVMLNILGERDGETQEISDASQQVPNVTVHMYGKSPTKVDRKMGHLTAIGDTVEAARQQAISAKEMIKV
jgi:5-(carboxyamino)imidazole ribonucleotide synthase